MLGGFGSARWRPVRAEVAQVHSVQYLAAGPAGDLGTLSSKMPDNVRGSKSPLHHLTW
jgi:hypothetical protein